MASSLAMAETIRRNGDDYESVDGARNIRQSSDGSVTFETPDGRTVRIQSGDWLIEDGTLYLRDEVYANVIDGAAAGGGFGGGAILGILGGLLGLGALAAAAGGGGGGGSGPSNPAPVVTSPSTANAPSNTTGTILTVTATDNGSIASMAISGGDDAGLFSMDADGNITFSGAVPGPNGSAAGTDDYTIEVTVTDDQGATTVQTITISLTAADNTPPSFSSGGTASVAEGTTDAVYTAAASDAESQVTYSLSGADAALFAIDPVTGEVVFIGAPDHENAQDAGGNNVYDIVVVATDAAGNTANQAVAITVTDINDNSPIFASPTASVSFDENDSSSVIYTATAPDADASDTVTYELDAASIAAGFAIDANSGEITHSSGLDYETSTSHTLVITASDGTNTDTQTLTVNVNDLDDTAPLITSGTSASVDEGTTTTAYQITATDNVGVTGYVLGGADAALFSVDASGNVTFNAGPDFEVPNSAAGSNTYTITVAAQDAAGNTSTPQTVTIDVTDLVPTVSTPAGSVTEGDYDTMVETGTLTSPLTATGGFGQEVTTFSSVVADTYDGTYGSLIMLADGSWTYKAEKSTTLTALDVGEVLTDTIAVMTDTGAINIQIVINGAEHFAEFASGHTGSITEGNRHDAAATATGTVVIDDPDTSDADTATVVAATGLAGIYGTLDIDASGNWSYSVDQSAIQHLRSGESHIDRIYVTLSDGGKQAIEVTINGADETFDDALYSGQHHFDDNDVGYPTLDMGDVWQRVSGIGVTVGITDDGVDSGHEDLAANYDASLEAAGYAGFQTGSGDSTHGTAVAGIIGAVGQNGTGMVGIAFNSTIASLPFLAGPYNGNATASAAMQALWDDFDVTNHSWGAGASYLFDLTSSSTVAFANAAQNGRGGLGSIVVKSAGNDHGASYGWSSSQAEGADVTRHSITVGAMNRDGGRAAYSNTGANLLVSAPAGEFGDGTIRTTDRSGSEGYNGINSDYTDDFNGTSAAAPMVSGIVALMLEANPDLGWRDVKDILAASAVYAGTEAGVSSADADQAWDWLINDAANWNGGGMHFSNDFGFGKVHAANAVALAETWLLPGKAAKTSGNEVSHTVTDTTDKTIVDNANAANTPVSYTLSVGAGDNMLIESMQIYLDFGSSDWAYDFDIDLEAPDGTVFQLADADVTPLGFFDGSTGDIYQLFQLAGSEWTFGLEGARGMEALGDWTITVDDTDYWDNQLFGGDGFDEYVLEVSLTFYGTALSDDDVYVFTDEFDVMVAAESGRASITDAVGSNTLNGAALTTAFSYTASSNAATIDGTAATLDGAFEKVIGGSAADTFDLSGEANAVSLWGREGADTLIGGNGADRIEGGYGDDIMTGNGGADMFVFTPASGANEITDFEVGTDTIELNSYGLDESDLYCMLGFDGSGNVTFTDVGTSIVFTGVTCLTGIEDSFTFVA